MQRTRKHALMLYDDIASRYGHHSDHWACREGMAHAVGRAALPHSLKQLSAWLARGGMALGAPHACICTALCVLPTLRCRWAGTNCVWPAVPIAVARVSRSVLCQLIAACMCLPIWPV